MRHIKYIFFQAVFALSQMYLSGQITKGLPIKRCTVKTIGIDQGLLNQRTNSIVTDSLGFTWVSTRMGLQRYNGYILENVNPVVGKDTIFINTPVFLFGLQNGSVWICHKKGILEYVPANNLFKKISSITVSESPFFSTVPLMQTPEGIWCMQENKGIVIYRNGVFYPKKNDSACILSVNTAINSEDILTRKIISTNNSYIFIRINARQILQINVQTHQFKYLGGFDGELVSFGCDANNFFCETNISLYSFSIAPYSLIKKILVKNFYSDTLIFGCIQPTGENNSIMIGFNGLLYEFDTGLKLRREFTTLSKDPLANSSFKHQIYIDKMKRFWLLTNNDIEIVRNTEVPFEHFIYPTAKSNSTRCIYYDKEKSLVLAGCVNVDPGHNGGIRLFDTLSNALWAKPLAPELVGSIVAIERLNNDCYLVVTGDRHGWYLLDLGGKKLSPFILSVDAQTQADLYSTQWINNLQRIDDKTLYVATPKNIFSCVFSNTKLKKADRLLPFNINSSNAISCFIYTSDSTLWVGTNSGLIYRLKKNRKLDNVQIIGGYTVRCFAQDSLKHVWVGTDKGAYVFSETGDLLKSIDKQSGMLNDYIYAILPVSNTSSVFASNNMGISFISLNGTIRNYTKEFGLQSNEFNTESAAKSGTGKFYFGGVNGINSFYPEALSETIDTPILNITHLLINDSLLNASTGSWNGDTLALKYPQNHIQLDLAAMGLFNADEYTYTYRLSNFENVWQTTHQPIGIKYTLSPGKYLLEVKCSPILSPDNISYKKLSIIVYPPWWQTWWFRFIAFLALIAITAFIVWQYNREKFAQKIKEMEIQHQIQHERERISRDLHDNLGAYAAAIAVNVSKVKEGSQAPKMIEELQSNSQAIVTQLNDTIWALNREAISLTAISDRFKVFLQKIQPSYQHIIIDINESIGKDAFLSPANALHLFRIMQEAVNNAARHSKCTHIHILIESDVSWCVTIKDDGVGIKGDDRKTSGNGLRNMRLRASEARWDIKWEDEELHGTRLTIRPVASGVL